MSIFQKGLGNVRSFQHRGMAVFAFDDNGITYFSVNDRDMFQSTYGTNTVATPKDNSVEVTEANQVEAKPVKKKVSPSLE
jgi:hypothetical protein